MPGICSLPDSSTGSRTLSIEPDRLCRQGDQREHHLFPPTDTDIVEQGDPAHDPRAFRRALGQFATGVTVVSTSDGTQHVGMAVTPSRRFRSIRL